MISSWFWKIKVQKESENGPRGSPVSDLSVVLQELAKRAEVLVHIHQRVIIITEDKFRSLFEEYGEKVKSRQEWHTPASVLVTLIASTAFQDLFFSREAWQTIHIIICIACLLWLIKSLCRMPKNCPAESAMREIKKGQSIEAPQG